MGLVDLSIANKDRVESITLSTLQVYAKGCGSLLRSL